MLSSITETLKKINTELAGGAFLSIVLTLILLSLFLGYKIISLGGLSRAGAMTYQKSIVKSDLENKNQAKHFIYASSRGTKYYYFNCKSTIKEANKIYFETEQSAERAGYTLSKTCK